MQKTTTNVLPIKIKSLQFFILIAMLLCVKISTGQNPFSDSLYIERVKTSLEERPDSYSTLETIFYKDKRDSLKMIYLKNQAIINQYSEAKSYALNALGTIYRNKSLYEKAIDYHKQAIEAAIDANNNVLHTIALNSIGVAYRRMDLVKPALDYHKEAYDLAVKQNKINPDPDLEHSMAISRNSMGNIYLVLKQYDLALKQFEKSLLIEKETKNKLGLAINYQNIGFALEHKGNLNQALVNYKISLDYNAQMNSEIGRVICNNAITQIYIKQEKYEDALTLISETLNDAKAVGDQYYLAKTYINLGWAQERLNLDEDAETNLKNALQISKAFDLKTFTSEALLHLSDIYTETENYKDALQFYKESKEIENSVTNDRNLNYVNDLIIKYEHEFKNNQIQELADENEIVRHKLERNKKLFWYTAILISLFTTMIIIIIRHRQVKQEKQIITLEQDMLRSQMNPHFIFNSLNSIKLYIINNDKEKAVHYLNKFSKLIRKILIASTEKEMTLEDELDTMKLYINIENIRFENEILFEINVDEGINTANIKVPSLILQPFLENALWHGLSSKKHDKRIDLHVFKDSVDYINISITDNGIGREEAEKINSLKLLKRKSVGIAITKARLANFSKRYSNDYKFIFEDLYNDKNRPKGTKVILQIPVPNYSKK
ncbi:tetratricopeptide repeat protein [Formosa sp. PL04]|uniref:tetratricopeptide repeat-containing sensor histidine kinase n=1 Tax=Formosa sp. PL04 TaxID=3081755 RepID=UPI0029819847|nr:tetratricopeptide repeat protein [Formosa sp. PL04]MDW5289325.1 tetratricopeptide repeat protein [Formosa sp. PL04]